MLASACSGLAGEPQIVSTLPPQPTSLPISTQPQQAPDVLLGAQVFAENCTRCHGVTGLGDGELVQSGQVTIIVDFSNRATMAGESPANYFSIITEGRLQTLMPPWGDSLSEAERWSAALYVYTLHYTPDMLAQGQTLWENNCVRCHGADGQGAPDGRPLPDLSAVSDDEAVATVASGLDQDRMPAFGQDLSVDEQYAVVAYARTLGLANFSGHPLVVQQPVATEDVASAAEPNATQDVASVPEPNATQEVSTAATGTITGRVLNGTAGGVVPPSLPVTLHIVDADFNEVTFDTTADATGAYQFENVQFLPDSQYLVTASYNDVSFVSEVVPIDPASGIMDIPVTVYELGADASAIHVDTIMTQVIANESEMQLVQITNFVNTSDRVFVNRANGTQTSVGIAVPAGATYLDMMGTSYAVSADGTLVMDSEPIVPGSSHLMHALFSMPYTNPRSIQQTMYYAFTGQAEVLLATQGLSFSGDGWIAQGARTFGNSVMPSFGADLEIPAGQTLNFTISGTPASDTTAATTTTQTTMVNPLAYVLIGIGIGAILVAGGLYISERRSLGRKSAPVAALSSNDLLKQIADLDLQHQEGKLDRKTYEQKRAELKAQLTAQLKTKE
ncbi:MAG: c-type cytochrome [Anaerolineae bacterium]